MTKIEIYDQIAQITSELEAIGISRKLFNVAKKGNAKKIDKIIKTFKRKRIQTLKKIDDFSKKYKELFDDQISIFGEDMYSIDTINSSSFFIFILFAEIDELNLFETWSEYNIWLELIKKEGYEEIAIYLKEHSSKEQMEVYSNIPELLVDIFKVKV